MDRLPPELKHLVASWLNTEDACSLRRVSKGWDQIAVDYILPHVHFFLDRPDLMRLQSIATHPSLARRVKSLTYFTHRFRPMSLEEMVVEHSENVRLDSEAQFPCIPEWQRNYLASDIPYAHQDNCHLVEDQAKMIEERFDSSILESALPKLTALDNIYVGREFHSQDTPFYSDGTPFYPDGRPGSYFDGRCWAKWWATRDFTLFEPDFEPYPAGKAALETVLKALLHTELRPKQIHASAHWRFFDRPLGELLALFRPLAKASLVELWLSMALPQESEVPDDPDDFPHVFGEARQCSATLASTGALRAILQTMTRLKNLRFGVKGRSPDDDFFIPISLDMIITPRFRWPYLATLALADIRCNRQALWQVLEHHKDTLTVLHFQEITLEECGSWRKLLPDIRNYLDLQEAYFTGHLRGYITEDAATTSPEEIWLGLRQEPHDMRESLNCYCRRGGADYPDELPLTDRVVYRNFEKYVYKPGMVSRYELIKRVMSDRLVDKIVDDIENGMDDDVDEFEDGYDGDVYDEGDLEDDEREHAVDQFTHKWYSS